MDEIALQIQRIKKQRHEYKGPNRLRPCLSEQEVFAFENEFKVRLPEEYRRFLLEVGNGEAFRPQGAVGSEYFSTWTVFGVKSQGLPDWFYRNLYDFWGYLRQEPTNYNYGRLLLCDCGCGSDICLIATGRERGTVWQRADEWSARVESPSDFLSWYERFMDERLAAQRTSGLRAIYGSDYPIVFPNGDDGPNRLGN